ncbi:MAG: hypothetical protein CR971_00735 [candidate division SR1 bacterium]|nr:MAG: hypothetical protein CR971_00735 [candidate division SR1 bacterium]
MTPAGKKLWFDYLRNTKHKCYRQRPIDHFIADFYISSSDLVIEIDGNIHDSQKEGTIL